MLARLTIASVVAVVCGSLASAQTYEGDVCTDHCSGHRAGYEWAAENGLSEASQCGGTSASFLEGCEAFADNPDREDPSLDDAGNPIEE